MKLKQNIFCIITTLTTVIPFSVSANTDWVNPGDTATYDSKGSITYVVPTDPTDPVDPLDPTHPVTPVDPTDPTKPVEPGTAGPLSIDFASSFDFGNQSITSSDMTYYAVAQSFSDGHSGPNYVQVTDNRGTLSGWTLSVLQNAQFSTGGTGAGSILDGAQISLSNGHIVSASATPADQYAATTSLVPGAQSGMILGAISGNGAGTSLLAFGTDATADTSVSLTVPGATTKLAETYTTVLTWTLSDTPA